MIAPYYDHAGIQLWQGDSLLLLDELDLSDVDLVVTDPPYGTGGWRRYGADQGKDPSGHLVKEGWDYADWEWIGWVPDVPIITFCPSASTYDMLHKCWQRGLSKARTLYMRKRDPKPLPQGRTKWSVEPIWVLSQAGFVLNGGDDVYDQVYDASTPRLGRDKDATGHPYQKSLEVMKWLIEKTGAKVILDPFAGSGTTLVAAKILGRKAIGLEVDPDWCQVTANRLRQEVMSL